MIKLVYKNECGNSVHWKVHSENKLSEDMAVAMQHFHGKHTGGYGFYDFKTELNETLNIFVSTWKCQSSCD